ncbi:MAG: hypothetical protein K6U11_09765 [bacterium]|nr:hypothetical protein [bacterium]
MEGKSPLTIKDAATVVYQFEESLNRAILGIGSTFGLLSHKAARSLHTGYWRTYVFIIFSAIILFILMNLWIAKP